MDDKLLGVTHAMDLYTWGVVIAHYHPHAAEQCEQDGRSICVRGEVGVGMGILKYSNFPKISIVFYTSRRDIAISELFLHYLFGGSTLLGYSAVH